MKQADRDYIAKVEASLGPKARQWLENYHSRDLTWYDKFLMNIFADSSKLRPATMEKDRDYLIMVAQQCESQNVKFPRRIGVIQLPLFNAAYIPYTDTMVATQGSIDHEPKPVLHATIGHETGHAKQRWFLIATIIAGVALVEKAYRTLYHYGYDKIEHGGDMSKWRENLLGGLKFLRGWGVWYAAQAAISNLFKPFEYDADHRAATHTNPLFIADALKDSEKRSKIREEYRKNRTLRQKIVKKIINFLYPFDTHPKIEKRIARLEASATQEHRREYEAYHAQLKAEERGVVSQQKVAQTPEIPVNKFTEALPKREASYRGDEKMRADNRGEEAMGLL